MSTACKIFCVVLFIVAMVLHLSCSDFGSQPPLQDLRSNRNSVTLLKATAVQVNLSNGTLPYIIKSSPDATIATATLLSSTLTITGVDTGHTFVIVRDSKRPDPDTLKIEITVALSLPVSFADEIQPIFNAHCINCHGGSGGLTLTAGTSYNQLVHVLAQSSCTVMYRVLPYQATNSVLYRKVSGTSCGETMPTGGSLTTTEINLIRDWINQGAPQ